MYIFKKEITTLPQNEETIWYPSRIFKEKYTNVIGIRKKNTQNASK